VGEIKNLLPLGGYTKFTMTPPLKPEDAENMSPYPLWLGDRAVHWPGLIIFRESLEKLLLTSTVKTVVALRLVLHITQSDAETPRLNFIWLFLVAKGVFRRLMRPYTGGIRFFGFSNTHRFSQHHKIASYVPVSLLKGNSVTIQRTTVGFLRISRPD